MHGQDHMAELQLPCAGEKREKSLHDQGSPGRAAGAGCASCWGAARRRVALALPLLCYAREF